MSSGSRAWSVTTIASFESPRRCPHLRIFCNGWHLEPIAAQWVDLVYNPARTGAASKTAATVTVSQERVPEPPGRYREVCETFAEGPCQMLTGVWTQWPPGRSARSRRSRNWPRLRDPRESHSDQMENRYVREEVRE